MDDGLSTAWQSSMDAVGALQRASLELDTVAGNAMLTASTARRWGWIQALSMLANMACFSLALSEAGAKTSLCLQEHKV